jgi:HAMP domain-containing protein
MTILEQSSVEPLSGKTPDSTIEPTKRRIRLGMRWKMLAGFGAGFTVVFLVVALVLLNWFTGEADRNLRQTLTGIAVGGAQTIDGDPLPGLIDDIPTRDSIAESLGELYPAGAGLLTGTPMTEELSKRYPIDERYWALVDALVNIRRTNPEASPYLYAYDGAGELAYVTSWAARGKPTADDSPAAGVPYLISAEAVGAEAVPYLLGGLERTTEQPGSYTDDFGDWISVYTPVFDSNGAVVGGLGVDYYYTYVSEVRSQVITTLLWVFVPSYLILMGIVVWLSGWLTRRLGRLSAATRRVAEGDYDVDLSGATDSRFVDEMTDLAGVFKTMVAKVGIRERTLSNQVQVLKVEIDEQRRQQSVDEIVDSDFFAALTSKASSLRQKIRDSAAADAAADAAGD